MICSRLSLSHPRPFNSRPLLPQTLHNHHRPLLQQLLHLAISPLRPETAHDLANQPRRLGNRTLPLPPAQRQVCIHAFIPLLLSSSSLFSFFLLLGRHHRRRSPPPSLPSRVRCGIISGARARRAAVFGKLPSVDWTRQDVRGADHEEGDCEAGCEERHCRARAGVQVCDHFFFPSFESLRARVCVCLLGSLLVIFILCGLLVPRWAGRGWYVALLSPGLEASLVDSSRWVRDQEDGGGRLNGVGAKRAWVQLAWPVLRGMEQQ